MSENEMLNKKETLEEALGEEIEAVKGGRSRRKCCR